MGSVQSTSTFPYFRWYLTPSIDDVLSEDESAKHLAEHNNTSSEQAAVRNPKDGALPSTE